MIIHNKVYNLQSLMGSHPGGDDILLSRAGTDATKDFEALELIFGAVGDTQDTPGVCERNRMFFLGSWILHKNHGYPSCEFSACFSLFHFTNFFSYSLHSRSCCWESYRWKVQPSQRSWAMHITNPHDCCVHFSGGLVQMGHGIGFRSIQSRFEITHCWLYLWLSMLSVGHYYPRCWALLIY